jgi:predicted anti-sigma-YlaC factor YlaD
MPCGDGALLDAVLALDPGDVGCGVAGEALARYVEQELRGEDPAEVAPGVALHLRMCPACRADHDGLLELTEHDRRTHG